MKSRATQQVALSALVLFALAVTVVASSEFSIMTWNVRGYPEVTFERQMWFSDVLSEYEADILCVQEIANNDRVSTFLTSETLYATAAFLDSSDGQDNAIFFGNSFEIIDAPDPVGFSHPVQLAYFYLDEFNAYILTVHLAWTDVSQRAAERTQLAAMAKGLMALDPDLIVAGDFNTTGGPNDTIEGLAEDMGLTILVPTNDDGTTCAGSHYDYILVSPSIMQEWSPTAEVITFDNDTIACEVSDHRPVLAHFDKDTSGADSVLTLGEASPVIADVVTFPDPGLEAAIRDAIVKPMGDIQNSDLSELTQLDASRRDIANLEGIQHCVDLTALWLADNQIIDISPLAGLTDLTILSLSRNEIVDISALSELIDLVDLNIGRNVITDINPLGTLTSLVSLWAGYNDFSDLGALSSMTHLQHLHLMWGHVIADVSPLSGLVELTYLDLQGNDISDVGTLAGLTNLFRLVLGWNKIHEVSALSTLTNLQELYLPSNQISYIAPLSGLTNLTELDLHDNQIVDIAPIWNFQSLVYLGLSGLAEVDVQRIASTWPGLETLYLSSCGIGSIEFIRELPNLRDLDLSSNEFVDISPLLDVEWAWSWNYVDLRSNYLDLTPGSPDMLNIEALQGRGVQVRFEPQN